MVLSSTFLSPFYMVAIITSLTSCNQRRTIYAKQYVVIYNFRLCFIEKLKRSSKNSHSLLLISHLLLMILLLSLDTKLLFLSLRKFI
jgi:hypothetical protein